MDRKEQALSGYKNVKKISSRSGSSGSWIEWEETAYVGQSNVDGQWYRIEIYESDNPYKGPPKVSVTESKLSDEELQVLSLGE